MVEQSTRYAMRTTMELPFELALDRTRKALARGGFGILSDIDMATALHPQSLALDLGTR